MQKITGKILQKTYLSGGNFNQVVLLECEKGKFVKKYNNQVPPDYYEKESADLELLRQNGLRVPRVLVVAENFILLEYYGPGIGMRFRQERNLLCCIVSGKKVMV